MPRRNKCDDCKYKMFSGMYNIAFGGAKQVCPVCGGKGKVPLGFYEVTYTGMHTGTTGSIPGETCRTCNGGGVI